MSPKHLFSGQPFLPITSPGFSSDFKFNIVRVLWTGIRPKALGGKRSDMYTNLTPSIRCGAKRRQLHAVRHGPLTELHIRTQCLRFQDRLAALLSLVS